MSVNILFIDKSLLQNTISYEFIELIDCIKVFLYFVCTIFIKVLNIPT